MEHTPGKWKQYGSMVYSPDNGVVCQVSEPHPEHKLIRHIGIDIGSPDWKEAMANARLIAVAPDLLAACEALLEKFEDHYHIFPDYKSFGRIAEVQQAQAAIAKARGGETHGRA